MAAGVNIPEDLFTHIILHKLPLKSLFRCTSVCKSWYSLITSSLFMNTHVNVLANNVEKQVFTLACRGGKNKYSFHRDNDTFDKLSEFVFPSDKIVSVRILSNCNGLICIHVNKNYDEHNMYLWNPSIRRVFPIPPYDDDEKWSHVCWRRGVFGFGFNSETNDFAVVNFGHEKNQVAVYELNTGSWKKGINYDEDFTHQYDIRDDSEQCFINNTVYWKADPRYNKSKSIILTYNLVKDELGLIKVPPQIRLSNHVHLTHYNDSLALVNNTYNRDRINVSIWVTINKDGKNYWTKHLSIDLNNSIDFRYMGDAALFERLVTNPDHGSITGINSHYLDYADYFSESLTLFDKQGSFSQDLLEN